jgi:hypothetical protein
MNVYSEKLNRAAVEVLEYLDQNKEKLSKEEHQWLRLARQLKDAASLPDNALAEQAINTIGHLIIDEFPIRERFSPNFTLALDAVQRAERRRRRNNS